MLLGGFIRRAVMQDAALWSPLPQDECVRRLAAAAGPRWSMFGNRWIILPSPDGSFRVAKRSCPLACLRATLAADPPGTRVECRFGPRPVFACGFLLFFRVWIGGVILVALPLSFLSGLMALAGLFIEVPTSHAPNHLPHWAAALLGPAMLAFGWAFVRGLGLVAGGHHSVLRELLHDTIGAVPAATRASASAERSAAD